MKSMEHATFVLSKNLSVSYMLNSPSTYNVVLLCNVIIGCNKIYRLVVIAISYYEAALRIGIAWPFCACMIQADPVMHCDACLQ